MAEVDKQVRIRALREEAEANRNKKKIAKLENANKILIDALKEAGKTEAEIEQIIFRSTLETAGLFDGSQDRDGEMRE